MSGNRRKSKKVLGPELGALFCRCYDIQPGGNFEEGESIPHLPVSLSQAADREKIPPEELTRKLEAARQTLFELREAADPSPERRQDPHRLERPDDRRPGQGGPGPG